MAIARVKVATRLKGMSSRPEGAALSLSGSPVLTAAKNLPYDGFTVTATGGSKPYTYALVGTWPTGITINASTGAVSGTPTQNGTFAGLSVKVTDHSHKDFQLDAFSLVVADFLITSSASVGNSENAVLSQTLVANRTITAWSIVGGADQARFEISGSTLRWAGNGTKNYEVPNDADTNNVYVVTVRATDTGSNTKDQTVSVTVANANDAPVITSGTSFSTDETQTPVTTLTSTDEDTGATHAWSIIGGADGAQFTINSSTGVLAFTTPPDFEIPSDANSDNIYVVIVQVSDGTLTANATLNVTVNDVAEPTGIVVSNLEVPASSSVGTLIGYLLTNGGVGTYTYALTSDPSSKLTIVGNELRVNGDISALSTYAFSVRSTDSYGQQITQSKTVTVTAVTNPSGQPASGGTIVDDGAFTIAITKQDTNQGVKIAGKSGGTAKFIYDIGKPYPSAIYSMQYTPHWDNLSNLGREAMVGMGFKRANNDFHIVGEKGDGGNPTTVEHKYKISGSGKFNANNGFTTSDGGAITNGTKDGPNLQQIEFDGTAANYTFRSGAVAAPSYANAGGTGDRTATITVTTNVPLGGGTINNLVDGVAAGNSTDACWFNGGTPGTAYVHFQFDDFVKITEATWKQDINVTHGVWQWYGTNDQGVTLTPIGTTFTLGGTAQVQSQLSGNTQFYVGYRLIMVSGATSTGPWLEEVEFKITRAVWTAEYTASAPSPLATASLATTFGIGMFLENSDKGVFSLDINLWRRSAPIVQVSQLYSEVIGAFPGSARVSQLYSEVIGAFPGQVRVSQVYDEVIAAFPGEVRASQIYAEIIRTND